MQHDQAYLDPGVLWWAFDRKSAADRGEAGRLEADKLAKDPSPLPGEDAVVLIDEIDKADPDLPNALLVALESYELEVEPIRFRVKAERRPLVIITTNGERDLPSTLVRRCICLDLPPPTAERLVQIAEATLQKRFDKKLCGAIADWLVKIADDYPPYARPSTAEYLDTIQVCLDEKITTDHPRFGDVVSLTVKKEAVRVA
jgi:MoxR-like ATPase